MDHIPRLSSKVGLSPLSGHLSALNKQSYSTRDLVYDTLEATDFEPQLPPVRPFRRRKLPWTFRLAGLLYASFVRLAQEGLLEVYPQRGTYVSLIQLHLVEEARFMREQLERAVIRLACAQFPEEKMSALEQNLTEQQQCLNEPDDERMFQLDEEFHSTLLQAVTKQHLDGDSADECSFESKPYASSIFRSSLGSFN